MDGAGHGAQRQALGQRIDRLVGGQGLAGAQDVVGMHHLGEAVEELDPAGDDAALAGGELRRSQSSRAWKKTSWNSVRASRTWTR